MNCATCGNILLFSARQRGDGYCGPCSNTLADGRDLVVMPDNPLAYAGGVRTEVKA